MDRGAWRAIVHGEANSQIQLGNQHFHFTFIAYLKDARTDLKYPTHTHTQLIIGGDGCIN